MADDPKNRKEGSEPDDDDQVEATADDADEGDEDAEPGDGDDGEEDVSAGDEAESEGGEAEAGQDVAEELERPKRRSANDRIRELRAREKTAQKELDEERGRREAADRRAEEAERRANERRAQETAQEEAARVELMSSDDKIAHFRQKDREEHQREMAGVNFRVWDSADRAEFREILRDDPLVAQVKDAVEKRYQELSQQGRPVSRAILADLEVGKLARAGRLKAVAKQRERAAAGVRRETVRAPKTRSDVAPNRARRGEGDERAARLKRLEDVQL